MVSSSAPGPAVAAGSQTATPAVRLASAASIMQQKMVRDLWIAALASTDESASRGPSGGFGTVGGGLPLDMLALLNAMNGTQPAFRAPATPDLDAGVLKSNEIYRPAIDEAARRTGIPGAAVAAIISAEADSRDGVWDPNSRNPRSTALGLTQFLSSTWETEAERPGTLINEVARSNGWLDGQGRVQPGARADLLALRTDPRLSIVAAAEYASANLARLRQQNLIPADASAGDLAKLAYLAHQLGVGDAERFLKGEISEGRARTLLNSQIGTAAASDRIAANGSGTQAHRAWLIDYVDRKIDISGNDDGKGGTRSLGAIARAVA